MVTFYLSMPVYYCCNQFRTDITKRLIRHYIKLKKESSDIKFILALIGSEGDTSRSVLAPFLNECLYLEFDQGLNPYSKLSDKYAYCVASGREYDPDATFIVSCDSFLTDSFFTSVDLGYDMFGTSGRVNFYNTRSGESFYWNGIYRTEAEKGFRDCIFNSGPLGWSKDYLNFIDWKVDYGDGGNEAVVEKQATSKGRRCLGIVSDFWNIKCSETMKDNSTDLHSFYYAKQICYDGEIEKDRLDCFITYYEGLNETQMGI